MIVMYHKVDLWSPTMWWVEVASFYRQMCLLAGKEVVYLDDYVPGNPNQVVITFDGVYANVLEYALPILERFGYPFELFVSSDWIGSENQFDRPEPNARFANAAELKQLVAKGGRLQWHTRSHPPLRMGRADRDWSIVDHELEVPSDIRELDTAGFKWFAYPHGEFSEDVVSAVRSKFAGAVSCHQGNDLDVFKLNRKTALNSPLPGSPSIHVIVVSYNYGEFLSEAIESVLSQTLLPDAILIVDDGSVDNTRQIGEKYAALYPNLIRFERNAENLGIVETFNRAASMSQCDYMMELGADNRISSNYVELSIRTLLSKGSEIAYTDFRLFGDRASEEYFRHPAERQGRIIDGQYFEVVFPEVDGSLSQEGNYIHGSSMYAKRAFEAVGGYQARLPGRPEDANLFHRMRSAGSKASKVDGAWLEYRQHSPSQANSVSRLQGEVEFLRVYAKRLQLKSKALEASVGFMSPFVRVVSALEERAFRLFVSIARAWRRRFR